MRLLLLSIAFGIASGLSAQEHFCNTTEMQNKWFAEHPELKAKFEKHQQDAIIANNLPQNTQQRTTASSNYTIPVVFHILHTGGSENISDAQVLDAMDILTRDFNARNADTSDVVVQFKNLIGNPQIEFQLAKRDPNGNCTNGIIRHWDTHTDWNNSFADYDYTWDASNYLNVYVVKTMGSGAAGYTYLPGSGIPDVADAIVILSNYVGSIGSGTEGRSRALTHEVGHWLNLPHVWGGTNQPGVACGDDGVTDTPITKGFSSCNLANANICNVGIVENMQNYMDYAYCSRMYTIKQAQRMVNALNSGTNDRNNLSSANNLFNTGLTNPATNCVPMLDINIAPTVTICAGKPLTLQSYTSNANPTGYAWSAPDAVITNPSAPSTAITFTSAGTKVVTCVASGATGNATKTMTVLVKNAAPEILASNLESFEDEMIPANWKNVTPTSPLYKWEVLSDASSHGIYSTLIKGETFGANAIAILESPSYDFKHNPGALFSFKYAYAKETSANKDVFKVQASKNCGGTWLDIYVPNNSTLAQGSGGIDNALFYPTGEQWKFQEITNAAVFNQFKTEENVLIRFFFQEDVNGVGHANRFYLDEINFSAPVGINQLSRQIEFSVYPNPSTSAFNLSFNLSDAAKIKYQVVSVTGAVLISEDEKTITQGPHIFTVNENGKLSAGIYFINLEMNGIKMSRKMVIQ